MPLCVRKIKVPRPHYLMVEAVAGTSKVEANQQCPAPWNLKESRGFLGLTGYCQIFEAGYRRNNFGRNLEVRKISD